MRGLDGKVIVVAGGGTGPDGPGIGATAARRLADEGARVVVGDLDAAAAGETAAAITAAGGAAVGCGFDLANEASVDALIARAVGEFGGLDGVHASAADLSPATLGRDSDALTVPLDVWERTLRVDLTGYLFVLRAAIPPLLAGGGGGVVFTLSDAAFVGERVRPAYGVAKAGLGALVRHVASRWGRDGIRCNAVSAGPVLKDAAAEALGADDRPGALKRLKSHRPGLPSDIAGMAVFLLSADGEWVNGQVYSVNGGLLYR